MKGYLKGHRSLAEMVSGHIHVWKFALEQERRCQNTQDGISYHDHELKALADIEVACKAEMGDPIISDTTVTIELPKKSLSGKPLRSVAAMYSEESKVWEYKTGPDQDTLQYTFGF